MSFGYFFFAKGVDMTIVYWILLIISSGITGIKLAQLQSYYKRRKVLTRDQREMAYGALIMFLGALGTLLWALYRINFK